MNVEGKTTENLIPQFDESDFELVLNLEEETEPEERETEEPQEPSNDVDDDLLATFNLLKDKGFVSGDDISSWEELDEKVSELPKTITNSIIESAPDLTKSLIDFAFNSGKEITKESLKDFMQTYLEDLDMQAKEVDLSTNELARDFLAKEYEKLGMRKTSIEAALDAMEDEDDEKALIKEAEKVLKSQKDAAPKHTSKLDAVRQKKEADERQAKLFIKEVDKHLADTGWTSKKMNSIKRSLVNGSANSIIMEASSSPKALVQLVNLTEFYDKDKGEFDFDAYIKHQTSKETEERKRSIAKNYFSSTKTKSDSSKNQPKKGLLDDLIPIN